MSYSSLYTLFDFSLITLLKVPSKHVFLNSGFCILWTMLNLILHFLNTTDGSEWCIQGERLAQDAITPPPRQ